MTLIESEGLQPSDFSALYVAGGFGNYLSPESAAKIGLLPKELAQRIKTVGNAALAGASMLVLNQAFLLQVEAFKKSTSVLDLSTNSIFIDEYTQGMLFGN